MSDTDEQEHQPRIPDDGDNWVNGEGWSPEHVPGIDEVPDATTYVDQPRQLSRRTMIIGIVVVIASIGIGLGFVLAANRGHGSSHGTRLRASASVPTIGNDNGVSTTTTTEVTPDVGAAPKTSPSTGPSSVKGPTATTKPAAAAPAPPPTAAPPTPRATANPALAPYQPKNVPLGVSATLTSCTWSGGELQAAGTITSHATTTKVWTVTAVWTQNSREMARTHLLTALTAGQAKPWALGLGAPNPPADLTCFVEIS
jgi:hypothetical protein